MKRRKRQDADYRKTEVANWKVVKRHNISETLRGFPFIAESVNKSHVKLFISFCLGGQVKIKSAQL